MWKFKELVLWVARRWASIVTSYGHLSLSPYCSKMGMYCRESTHIPSGFVGLAEWYISYSCDLGSFPHILCAWLWMGIAVAMGIIMLGVRTVWVRVVRIPQGAGTTCVLMVAQRSPIAIISITIFWHKCEKMGTADINTRLLEGKEQDDENEVKLQKKILDETKKIWIVAGPAIFTRFSTFGVAVITQAFVGHIGATELAAYALIQTVLLRFANGILLGMASALETLCGQAYGAKQHHMLGIYLQRSWIVLTICACLLLPIFLLATPILKLLGQQDDTAKIGGYIAVWFIPMLFGMIVSFTCQMYLQSQSKNKIISYLAAVTLIIHIFFSWLLVTKLKLGLSGAMISTVIAYWIPNLGQLIYVTGGWCPDTWNGLSWLAFRDLLPVIKLSLSSGVMLCLELWYNSILVLLTSNMPNANVAIDALSICLNINGWEMMIALGFLAAAGVRVSNELGRGSAKSAKFSILVIVLTSLSIGIVLFAVFLSVRGKVAYIFTNNQEVVRAVAQLSPLLACSMLLNSVQPVLSGVAVGSGWQGKVAYVNITCYYVIGIPLGVVLGYVVRFQVTGIWLGMLFGTLVQSIVLLIITMRTDWDQQVALAQQRVKKWFVPGSGEANGNETPQAA